MVKCLPEFEYFYCILENRNFISKIRISKVTDYAALSYFLFSKRLLFKGKNMLPYGERILPLIVAPFKTVTQNVVTMTP